MSNVRTLGGVVLDQDTASSQRFVTGISGWDDQAPSRIELVDKAGQDGAYDADGAYGARVISIEGLVKESTVVDAHTVRRSLTALTPRSLQLFSCVNDTMGELSAWTRVTGAVKVDWVSDRAFMYTVEVTAPDPTKYGTPQYGYVTLRADSSTGLAYPMAYPLNYGTSAATTILSLSNDGLVPYWPRLRMEGSVTNPVVTLSETGDWVRYNATLAADQWLDWDLANRRVLLNGQVSQRVLVTTGGTWLAVPPGGGSVTWAADASDSTARLFVWSYKEAFA